MPVVSASVTGAISFALPQVDGRYVMRETWTDNLGNQYTFDYMAPVGANVVTPKLQSAANIVATQYQAAQTVQQVVV